jgi:hypothetical protein
MKHNFSMVRSSLFVLAAMLALAGGRAAAQSKPDSVTAAQVSRVPARITQAIDETQLVWLQGNVHPLARPEFDRGLVSDATPMNRMLLLLQRSPEQEAALRQLMDEQQSQDSPNFHKWLTPEQFGKQFGPADADIQAVTDWLTRQGFQGIKVGPGRTAIEFSGNVGQVRNAFRTEIHSFEVGGDARQANVSDPQIPAALAPVAAGVVTLHNFPRKSFRHDIGSFTRTADGRVLPQFTGTDNNGPFYAVGPADFATIYNVTPTGLNGSNVTIGIVAVSNINVQDVADFQAFFGLPAHPPTVFLNGPDPGLNSAEGEADLDVQWAGAVAPNALVDLVVSEDTLTAAGIDLSALYIVDNNIADVMSESFGTCEAELGTTGNAFYNSLWQQAAAQGITVMISAGDPGSAGCDDFNTAKVATRGLAISGIASTPFNVAVGGTDFDDAGKQPTFWNVAPPSGTPPGNRETAKGYIPETTWNDSCAASATGANLNAVCVNPSPATLLNISGGSGGPSTCKTSTVVGTTITCTGGYAKPAWQNGLTPPDTHRDIPDVSLFASDGPTSLSFYVTCQADAVKAGSPPSCKPDSTGRFSFFGVGGTSASSPNFAGIMALINQAESLRTGGVSGRQGNANLVLYKIAQTASNSCNSSSRITPGQPPPPGCVFNDVTRGNNSVPCAGQSLNCSSNTNGTNGVLVDPANVTTPAWTTGPGYDLATGLGSVNVANLVTAWATAVGTFKGTSTSLLINGSTSPAPIAHGTSVTATATVASLTSGTPTGDVSLLAATSSNGGIGSKTLTVGTTSSTATLNTTVLPVGIYSVAAHYAGDGTFAGSDSNAVPVMVSKENSQLQMGIVTMSPANGAITSTNATSFAYGSPYVLRLDILNHTGTATNCQPLVNGGVVSGCASDATGKVTISDTFNGATKPLDAGVFPINSAGHAEDQPIQLTVGTHSLSASYSGDMSYNPPVGPVTSTLTVSQATTTTAVAASPSSVASGGTVTLTALVSTVSNGDAPCDGTANTGTVQFLNGGAAITGNVSYKGTTGAASSTGAASCTATLSTTLAQIYLPPAAPRNFHFRTVPLLLLAVYLTFLLLPLRWAPRHRRRAFTYAGIGAFLLLAAGFAGCGSSGGSNARTASITAKFSGDTNYAGSTTPSVATVTIQ